MGVPAYITSKHSAGMPKFNMKDVWQMLKILKIRFILLSVDVHYPCIFPADNPLAVQCVHTVTYMYTIDLKHRPVGSCIHSYMEIYWGVALSENRLHVCEGYDLNIYMYNVKKHTKSSRKIK